MDTREFSILYRYRGATLRYVCFARTTEDAFDFLKAECGADPDALIEVESRPVSLVEVEGREAA